MTDGRGGASAGGVRPLPNTSLVGILERLETLRMAWSSPLVPGLCAHLYLCTSVPVYQCTSVPVHARRLILPGLATRSLCSSSASCLVPKPTGLECAGTQAEKGRSGTAMPQVPLNPKI